MLCCPNQNEEPAERLAAHLLKQLPQTYTMGSKRKRDEISWWWTTLKEDIDAHGGFLHPSLGFCSETRQLKVMNDVDISNVKSSSSDDHDFCLLKIPKASMITRDLALGLITPWWQGASVALTNLDESVGFHSALGDLIIALGLACVAPSSTLEPTTSREARIATAYLAILPEGSSHWDALPRRWSEEQLQSRLGCSPLLNRIREARTGIERDFAMIQKACNDDGGADAFPVSFERFSDMVAVVSSRAFVIDETKKDPHPLDKRAPPGNEVALVPILDLCDHYRGGQDPTTKKNLSYTFRNNCMGVRSVSSSNEDTSSCLPLKVGETLRLTYGAQGNGQLLLNYGFTIPNNLEPDGSSNDILELRLFNDRGETVINLRTGPVSYTYGCFIKALEFFRPMDEDGSDSGEPDEKNDMEAFLNEEEDEEFDDGNDMGLYGDTAGLQVDDSDAVDDKKEIQGELAALVKFQSILQVKLQEYGPIVNDKHVLNMAPGPEYYSMLLLQSEMRTLQFFAMAARKIAALLKEESSITAANERTLATPADDNARMETQTDELAKAYMTIRHGNLT